MAGEDLLNELRRRQAELDMNDSDFAKWLGVPRPSWVLARRGYQHLGAGVLRAVKDKWPDLEADCGAYLLLKKNANAIASEHALPLASSGGAAK